MANSIVYDTLKGLLDDCIKYFKENCKHDSSTLILMHLKKIKENLDYIEPVAKDVIGKNAHKYDVVTGLQANGYRSLLAVLEGLLLAIIQILRNVSTNRSNTFFRGNEHVDKLQLCSDILHQLRGLLYYAEIMIDLTPNGNLFIDEVDSEPIMHDCEIMAKACFYGSLHGFQYSGGIQPVVHSLATFVASYNDVHQPAGAWNLVKSAINSGRYVLSPALRGEKLEKVYNGGDVQFFKKFWSLHEQGIIKAVPNFVGASVHVNRVFKISPDPFTLPSAKNPSDVVRIAFSSSLGTSKVINARLISSVLRENQNDPSSPSEPDAGFDKSKVSFRSAPPTQPKSKNLVFFCHGGGFIALTSKSYEMVLRQWSKDLDCPIFSVDYSLAPEAPFPEAFEECFYAYAWALKNAHQLGSTAENIVLAGDSAGGNLILSVALRAGIYGIQMPNSIIPMYPSCLVRYSASPARLLSVMDPLLPLGVLSGCLAAYSGVKSERVKRHQSHHSDVPRSSRPVSPSRQPVQMKYLSNFFKDVGEGFTRMTSSNEKTPSQSWWDEEFDIINTNEINGNQSSKDNDNSPGFSGHLDQENNVSTSQSSRRACMDFKIKLPHNYQPIRSKFCGDNFQMHHSPVVKNAFISPALASDDFLQNLPHVDIIACEFDPLFDDSIVLAKRLQEIGNSYQLHVIRGLPHGFLNLQISKESKDAAVMCMELIRKGLKRLKK